MWRQRKQNKYNAKTKEYGGRIFHSKKEAAYAAELELLKKAGEIKDYKCQHKLSLDVDGFHICNYYVDFLVINKDGEEELHEVKGFQTQLWRLKWKLTEAIYSDLYKLVLIT